MLHISEVSIVSTHQGIIGITIWVHHTLSKMNYIKFCVVMEFIFQLNLSIFCNDAWIVGHPKSYSSMAIYGKKKNIRKYKTS